VKKLCKILDEMYEKKISLGNHYVLEGPEHRYVGGQGVVQFATLPRTMVCSLLAISVTRAGSKATSLVHRLQNLYLYDMLYTGDVSFSVLAICVECRRCDRLSRTLTATALNLKPPASALFF
jgi:hypothetical protein